MTELGLPELPLTWTRAPLSELVFPDRPRHHPRDYPGLPFIGMEHVEAHSMRILGAVPARTMKSSAVHFTPGDVLYGRLRPYLNKIAQPEFEGLCSAEFIVFPPSEILDSKYLRYLLNSADFVSYASHLNEGDRPRVDFKQIGEYLAPVAPLPEQRRIVAEIETQFTRLDAAAAALERARANLKRYRASVLADVLDGPWPSVPLGEVSSIQGGIQKQPKRAPRANAYPFLRVANVLRGRLDLDEIHRVELFAGELEKLRLQAGDLLVVEGNGSQSEIGRMVLWDDSISDCVHQNHIIRVRLGNLLMPRFVEAYWNSPPGQQQVQAVASSTSGLYTLSVRKIAALSVPVPSLDEQERIVQHVDRRLSVASEIESAINSDLRRAERLRQSILRKAFAGQLVPQDPADEPASVLLDQLRTQRASAPEQRSRTVTRRRPRQTPLC